MQRGTSHVLNAALVLCALLAISIVQVSAAANPYDWFDLGGNDPLNFEATGSNGDYWTVSNLMGGVGWNNTQIISNQYADVAYPGQYVVQDNALAVNGDSTVFCTTPGCRDHTRLWGIPYRDSTDSIQAASTEHYWNHTHIVDSYNDGRDSVYWDLWPYDAVRYGWWTVQYSSGCIWQGDGTCAPYDGQVGYLDIQL